MMLSAAALLSTGAIAQRTAITPQALLERAEASLYKSGATVVDFSTQLRDKSGRTAGATTGKMHLQGDAFRLEEQTLTLSKPSQDELLQINPLYFLRSRAAGFTSRIEGKPAATTSVVFAPQHKSNIARIAATFQSQSGLPTQLVFTAKDKSILTARVTKVGTRSAYAPAFFSLSAKQFPGCEVVDLR